MLMMSKSKKSVLGVVHRWLDERDFTFLYTTRKPHLHVTSEKS